MLITATEFAMRWGGPYPRIESPSIHSIGSKLRLMLAPWEQVVPRLEYSTSHDGENWSEWQPMPILEAVDVAYPGYFKFRTSWPGKVSFYNFKTPAEADSITGLTLVAGTCEVRLIE